jgi:hypothetical protein
MNDRQLQYPQINVLSVNERESERVRARICGRRVVNMVLCYTDITGRGGEAWIVSARKKEDEARTIMEDQHPWPVKHKGGHVNQKRKVSENQRRQLELTNPTSVCLVHTRFSQVTFLEGCARTKGRRHGAAEVGIVRHRQGLQGTGESAWNSLREVVVV